MLERVAREFARPLDVALEQLAIQERVALHQRPRQVRLAAEVVEERPLGDAGARSTTASTVVAP